MDFQKFTAYIWKNLDYFSVEDIRKIINWEYHELIKEFNKRYISEKDKKQKKKMEEIVLFLYKFLNDYKKNAYKYNYYQVSKFKDYEYWFNYYISNNVLEKAEKTLVDMRDNFPKKIKTIKAKKKKLNKIKQNYQKEYKKIKEKEERDNRLKKIEKLIGYEDYGEAMYEVLRYLQKYPNDSKVNEYLTKIDKLKSSNIINQVDESGDFFEKVGLLDLTKKWKLWKSDIKNVYQKLNVLLKKKDFDSGLRLINFLKEKYSIQDKKVLKHYNKFINLKSEAKKKEQVEDYKLELNSLNLLYKNKQYKDALLKANAILKKYPMVNKKQIFNLIGKINKKRKNMVNKKEPWSISKKLQELNMRYSRMNKKWLYHFYEKMARFLRAKMDLKLVLQVIYYQAKDLGLKSFVKDIIDGLDSWIKISETLNWYKQIPKLDVTLVKIWESTWKLWDMFQAIYDYHKESDDRSKKIKSIMIYPVVIVVFALLIFVLLLIFIIPKFIDFYAQVGAELPLITQKVVALSFYLRNSWYELIIWFVLFLFFYNLFKRTKFGKYTLWYLTLRIPVVKKIVYRKYIIYFSSNLSLLLSAWINLLEAIDLIISWANNPWYKDEFERIRFELETGVSFAKAVWLSNVENVWEYSNYYIPIDFAYTIDIWEQTWQLGEMLWDIGKRYDDDLKIIINNLQSLMEPFVIMIVWIVVFIFVISIFLPLINMYDLIGEMWGI